MAFAPEYQEINTQIQKMLHCESVNVPVNIQSGGFVIKQVLSINAVPTINSVICTKNNAEISGMLQLKALVMNAEREYQVLEQEVTFNAHLQDGDILDDTQMFASASFVEVNNIIPSENSISCNIKLNITSSLVKPQTIKYVQKVDNLSYQKTSINECNNIINCLTQNFEISNEVNLPNNISNILMTNAHCVLEESSTNVDMLTLKGKIYAQIVYVTNEEAPKLKQQDYTLDFSQELLSNGTIPEDEVLASLDVIKVESDVQGELSSSKGVLVFKTTMVANAQVVRKVQFESVIDAFCPHYALNLQSNNYQHQQLCTMQFDEKIDGSLSLPDDVRIDKILCVSSMHCMCNTMHNDESLLT